MQKQFSRKCFLALSASTLIAPPLFLFAQTSDTKKPKGDLLATDLVKELVKKWVGKVSADLAQVKELLTQEPRMLNASWRRRFRVGARSRRPCRQPRHRRVSALHRRTYEPLLRGHAWPARHCESDTRRIS